MIERILKPNIEMICTATKNVTLAEGQAFYDTGKSIEIWQEKPLPRMIKSFPHHRILWIIEKEQPK